jgi:hypothetical protein
MRYWTDFVPTEPEVLISLFIVLLSWATSMAYRTMDKDQAALRYFTRKDKTRIFVGLMTASLVVLTAAGAFSLRYVINECMKKATEGLKK